MKTVWKASIPVDDEWHVISGSPVHVECQFDAANVEVWFETPNEGTFEVRIFGTGHHVPDDAEHVGTWVSPALVWHVYKREADA